MTSLLFARGEGEGCLYVIVDSLSLDWLCLKDGEKVMEECLKVRQELGTINVFMLTWSYESNESHESSLGNTEQLFFSCVSSKVTVCDAVTCHMWSSCFQQTSNDNILEKVYLICMKHSQILIHIYFQINLTNCFRDIDVGSWSKKGPKTWVFFIPVLPGIFAVLTFAELQDPHFH